jgi:hypothetical protein
MDLLQLAHGDNFDIGVAGNPAPLEQGFGIKTFERRNHVYSNDRR